VDQIDHSITTSSDGDDSEVSSKVREIA